MSKIYKSRAAAREAAKELGGSVGKNSEGKWILIQPQESQEDRSFREWMAAFRDEIQAAKDQDAISNLYADLNDYQDAGSISNEFATLLDEAIGRRAAQLEAEAEKAELPPKAKKAKPPVKWIRESSVEKPTKLVWVIADSMPGASRKEVQAACVKAGIASGTARTQYQHWFKTRKDSEKEERAQIIDGKIVPAGEVK